MEARPLSYLTEGKPGHIQRPGATCLSHTARQCLSRDLNPRENCELRSSGLNVAQCLAGLRATGRGLGMLRFIQQTIIIPTCGPECYSRPEPALEKLGLLLRMSESRECPGTPGRFTVNALET